MAQYTRLFRSIWADHDYTRLPADAQRLYLLLISQPDISHCGVLPITLGRWSALAPDTTRDQLATALDTLAAARFVLIDWNTEELLVRSFMLHDGLSRVHNGDKAIRNAAARIMSQTLAAAVFALIEAPTEAPTKAPTEAPTELQQPAANSQQPKSSSQQPAATHSRRTTAQSSHSNTAAAAAIDHWITHKCDQPNVRNRTGLARTLRTSIDTEWRQHIDQHLARHPDSTWQDICHHVFGMTELDIYRTTITR